MNPIQYSYALVLVLLNLSQPIFSFSVSSPKSKSDGWINLIENNFEAPVKKWILEKEFGDVPHKGSVVEIDYIGTFGPRPEDWSVEDTLECWLKPQQGFYDLLKDVFRQNAVNGTILCDSDIFNEEFVEKLGATKIQCKKIVMAAKRLVSQNVDPNFQVGLIFDSSASKNKTFKFLLGEGKAIKAIDILVSSMHIGEKCRLQARSDFCYGMEGLRTRSGEVVVPPFATLCFDVTLISTE